jgi:hypothetical protein
LYCASAASSSASETIFFSAAIAPAQIHAAPDSGHWCFFRIGPGHIEFRPGLIDLLNEFIIVDQGDNLAPFDGVSYVDEELFQTPGDLRRHDVL